MSGFGVRINKVFLGADISHLQSALYKEEIHQNKVEESNIYTHITRKWTRINCSHYTKRSKWRFPDWKNSIMETQQTDRQIWVCWKHIVLLVQIDGEKAD